MGCLPDTSLPSYLTVATTISSVGWAVCERRRIDTPPRAGSCETAVMETVVDAFVWPLRLLGIAAPKEGELDYLPLLVLPPNCIVNHLVPALDAKERASLCLTCTAMSQLMAGSVKQLKFDGREMCYAARSPRLLQVG